MARSSSAAGIVLLCACLLGASSARAQCGDVDLNLLVDDDDVRALRASLADPEGAALMPGGYARCTVYGRVRPCDIVDVVVLRRHVTDPGLAPRLGSGCTDGDLDGVPDPDDRCSLSPVGVPFIPGEDGCTVLDLVLRPGYLVDPALAKLDEAARLLGGPALVDTHERLRELREAADSWLGELGNSAAALPGGYPYAYCDGRWDDAAAALAQARARVSADWQTIHGIVAAEAGFDALGTPSGRSEFPDAQPEVLALELGLVSVDEAIAEVGRAASALGEACAANVGPVSTPVLVEWIDDAAGLAGVRDLATGAGYPVALTQGAAIGAISAGTPVDLSGLSLGSKGTVATDMTPADPGSPGDADAGCLFLRVLPPQPPSSGEPILYGGLEPYQRNAGDVVLERDARLSVLSGGCPAGESFLGPFTRYSMRVEVDFPAGFPPISQSHLVVAPDLEPSDLPVGLPSALPDGVTADLTVTVRRQTCYKIGPLPLTLSCGPFIDHHVDTHTLTVVPTGSVCTANYSLTQAKLEDDDVNGFVTTNVTSLFLDSAVVDISASPQFRAQGCIAAPNATNCDDGQWVTVIGAGPIRLYNHDFFPLYGTNAFGEFLTYLAHGVKVPAGVRWPRVRGTRSAGTFHYSCTVPRAVRDVVNYCAAPEHSYYRLPYYPNGAMGKGNWDQDPGHGGTQSFAFDFGQLTGDEIRAARGGRVVDLHESSVQNDQACWDQFNATYYTCVEGLGPSTPLEQAKAICMNAWISFFGRECDLGNYLYIRHQDATYGVYFHMVHNGIYVSPNQIVHRSAYVGDMGNTGASAAPHLHFETVDDIASANSIPVRFQTQSQTCLIPQDNDQSLSSNDPAAAY